MDPLSPGEEEKPSAALRESWHRIFLSLLRMHITLDKRRSLLAFVLPGFGESGILLSSWSK